MRGVPVVRLLLGVFLLLGSLGLSHLSGQERAAVESFRLGSLDHEEESFGQISDLLVGTDGRIYISQGYALSIALYTPEGMLERRIGGPGRGPGEFRSITDLFLVGDTLWARDHALRRFNLFTPDGGFLRTFNYANVTAAGKPVSVLAPIGRSRFIGTYFMRGEALANGHLRGAPLMVLGPSGEDLDTAVVLHLRDEVLRIEAPSGRQVFTTHPYRNSTAWALSPKGGRIVVVDAPIPKRSLEGRMVISVIDALSGDTTSTHIHSYRPENGTKQMFENVVNGQALRLVSGRRAALANESLARRVVRQALEEPMFLPTANEVIVGEDGSMWIRREDARSGPVRWSIFDENGVLRFHTRLPRAMEVHTVTMKSLWGVEHGSGFPQVVRLEIR